MSSWNVGNNVEFDIMARYVDSLKSVNVPSYFSMDTRLAWRPTCCLELSVVGQNLLDAQHPEYGSSIFSGEIATQTQRGVYGMVTWGY
jgi:iron complex outermembrane receptor protein